MNDNKPVGTHFGMTGQGPSTSATGSVPPVVPVVSSSIRPPKSFGGRKTEDFRSWIQRLEQYFILAQTREADKVAILMLNLENTAFKVAEHLKIAGMP